MRYRSLTLIYINQPRVKLASLYVVFASPVDDIKWGLPVVRRLIWESENLTVWPWAGHLTCLALCFLSVQWEHTTTLYSLMFQSRRHWFSRKLAWIFKMYHRLVELLLLKQRWESSSEPQLPTQHTSHPRSPTQQQGFRIPNPESLKIYQL